MRQQIWRFYGLDTPPNAKCEARASWVLAPLAPPVIQLVLRHLPAQRVAVNPQKFCRPALIAVGSLQNPFDEALFEFTHGFIEQDSAFHHLSHKAFQLISHVRTLRACDFFRGPAYESNSRPTRMR